MGTTGFFILKHLDTDTKIVTIAVPELDDGHFEKWPQVVHPYFVWLVFVGYNILPGYLLVIWIF